MALVQKERTNELSGFKCVRLLALATHGQSQISYAKDAYMLEELQVRSLPLVLANLTEYLNDPASQGRPIALTDSQLIKGIPRDTHGSIIDDPHGLLYAKVPSMVDTVLWSVEFAENVSGRWIMAQERDLMIFFRVGLDFDMTVDDLIDSGTLYAPSVKKKGSKKVTPAKPAKKVK